MAEILSGAAAGDGFLSEAGNSPINGVRTSKLKKQLQKPRFLFMSIRAAAKLRPTHAALIPAAYSFAGNGTHRPDGNRLLRKVCRDWRILAVEPFSFFSPLPSLCFAGPV